MTVGMSLWFSAEFKIGDLLRAIRMPLSAPAAAA